MGPARSASFGSEKKMLKVRFRWSSLAISLVILICGLAGSRALAQIDQELRVIYSEYTLAATDLGHVNAELIRYRTTVLRAIEADKKKDFDRIAASLPGKQMRIETAIERFLTASNVALQGKDLVHPELAEVKAMNQKLQQYFASSHHTIELLERRWQGVSLADAHRLRVEAELHATRDSGPKYIDVTLQLDELVKVVANIAGDVKKRADYSLRIATIVVIAMSCTLAALVLVVPN